MGVTDGVLLCDSNLQSENENNIVKITVPWYVTLYSLVSIYQSVLIFRIEYSVFYPEDGVNFTVPAVKTSDATKTMPMSADKSGDVHRWGFWDRHKVICPCVQLIKYHA
jgi:hypothetical protein